ncbi:MAG: FAD-dependent oxidoreductase [Thermocladium sp.]|jgi:NADPH-dependent 2,4-dienoyl-CoA reductase/sulfur reductase-like enzyme
MERGVGMPEKIVIIGAGAAGASAAARARKLRPDAEITMIDKGLFITHAPCGIPYYVEGAVKNAEDLAVYKPEEFAKDRNINVLTNTEATSIDVDKRTINIKGPSGESSMAWDKLIIATGARPIIPRMPGTELRGVLSIRLPHEAPILKQEVEKASTIAVVGGGYIGLEMAEAVRSLGKRVAVFEMASHVFPTTFDNDMAQLIHEELRRNGVELHLGDKVVELRGSESVRSVVTETGTYDAERVILAVGVRPDAEIAGKAGIRLTNSGAIDVNEYMETSVEGIYAAGDAVETWNAVTGRRTYIALAPPANKMGQVAGANAAKGRTLKFPGALGTAITKVFNLYVARTGLTEEQAKAEGFKAVSATINSRTTAHYYPGGTKLTIKMVADEATHRVLGVQVIGSEKVVAGYIDTAAALIWRSATIEDVFFADLSYAPPTAPVWHGLITAARVLSKGVL